jgi:hypothetical protein
MKNKMRILAMMCAGLLVVGCENSDKKAEAQAAATTPVAEQAAGAPVAAEQAATPAAEVAPAVQYTGTETQAVIDPANGVPAELSTTTATLDAGVGASMTVPVVVKNTSQVAFLGMKDLAKGDDRIDFVVDYLDASGKPVDALRTIQSLPDSLAAGAEGTYQLPVTAPATAGQYTLQIDMVQQGKIFFKDAGTKPVTIPVTVK